MNLFVGPFPKVNFLKSRPFERSPLSAPPPGSMPHYDAPGYLSPSPNAPIGCPPSDSSGQVTISQPPQVVCFYQTQPKLTWSHMTFVLLFWGNKCLFCLHNHWVPNMFSILKVMSKCIHFNFGHILKLQNAY